jgi:hypothetical protein
MIKRDCSLSPVKDFLMNVQPRLKNNQVAEEVYENDELVGWKIVCIA